jgi:hypothetical protein
VSRGSVGVGTSGTVVSSWCWVVWAGRAGVGAPSRLSRNWVVKTMLSILAFLASSGSGRVPTGRLLGATWRLRTRRL